MTKVNDFKYKVGDYIMGIQNDVEKNMLFAGVVIEMSVRYSTRYKIKLVPEIMWTSKGEIWVSERFCVDFNQRNFDIARIHWANFVEYLINAKKQEYRAKLSLTGEDNLMRT